MSLSCITHNISRGIKAFPPSLLDQSHVQTKERDEVLVLTPTEAGEGMEGARSFPVDLGLLDVCPPSREPFC